ncbi:LytR/AlgR family response regulator transcription factor [Hymenobacter cavernae]|uniref:Response regulatory domain-containing protein n=1 Tax=Hymenobacter cavernae TaxID=2044852 RepID=A0ABQ1UBH2_9BACT|nr:hypothetical protein [Hymenobacter cavernae]GGF14124.1 hypothetical protein GCM10011383_26750 [Hymenobacter cavernae]
MRTLIIEDEYLAVEHLQLLLRKHPTVEVIAVLPSVAEAIHWLGTNPAPDLIFSDIQLSDGLSFEIYDAVAVRAPIIYHYQLRRVCAEGFYAA